MAFNSGSTTLVAASSVLVFHMATGGLGDSWSALVGAAVVAALPYLVSESVFGVLLMALLGEGASTALRHQLPLHAFAVPLAAWGALAGLAAVDVGWWAAIVVLAPVPLVPELLIVVVPRRRAITTPRTLVVAAVLTAISVLAVTVLAGPGVATTFAALGALALLVGLEGRPGAGVAVPLLVMVPLAAAVDVPVWGHGDAAIAVVLVAVVATAASWCVGPVRRARWSDLGWCVPLGTAAVAGAALWIDAGRFGPVVFALSTTVALVASAAWGAPPWGSRFVGRWASRRLDRLRRPLLVLATVAAVTCVVLGASLVAVLCAQAGLGMAATATRQWRFAPRRRVRDGVVVAAVSIASVAAVLAAPGGLAPIAAVVIACSAALVVAWPTGLLGRR